MSIISLAILTLLTAAATARAAWFFSAEADGRFWLSGNRARASLQAIGLSDRKTISDRRGDRWIGLGLVEVEDNFSKTMVHQLYLRYKGPLGRWNIAAGRFGLPFGLLSSYSTSRLPFSSLEGKTLGMDVDNGLLFSGTLARMDYGLSLSQGVGTDGISHLPGPGLALARVGLVMGSYDQNSLGLSMGWGHTTAGHAQGQRRANRLLGLDLTGDFGMATARAEAVIGEHRPGGKLGAFFTAADLSLLPKIDINASASFFRQGGGWHEGRYLGLAISPGWMVLRLGWNYSNEGESKNEVVLQLYRLYSMAL